MRPRLSGAAAAPRPPPAAAAAVRRAARALIRRFRADDAPALVALFHESVRETGALDYSPAQVAAWSPVPRPPAVYVERARTRTVLVAVDADDVPIGYGDLEPDAHLDHLYCRPDRVGRGVGSALLAAIDAAARTAGLAAMHVEASEGARRLFERRGWRLVARRDFPIGAVAMHNWRMTMALD